jgi:hypothetical protein
MNILFFVFLAVFIISFIFTLLNIKSIFNTGDLEKGFGNHIYCMIGSFVGGLGSFLTGIMWLVEYFKA